MISASVRRICLSILFVILLPAQAWAAVEISFYSRELGGNNFPHAFVTLRGTVDSTGAKVDTSYGFTAKTVSPAILFGSVAGMVVNEKPGYIAKSDRQFSLVLTDAQYQSVMEVVEAWRNRSQPSYNLDRRNCVHFVGEIARAVGLTVSLDKKLMKKPRSFLLSVRDANRALLHSEPAG